MTMTVVLLVYGFACAALGWLLGAEREALKRGKRK